MKINKMNKVIESEFDFPSVIEININKDKTFIDKFTEEINEVKKVNNIQKSVNFTDRKKLLMDIYFLTNFIEEPDCYCMYMDASSNMKHMDFLSGIFPNIKFLIFNPLIINYKNSEKITYFKTEFSLEEFNKISTSKNKLLISWVKKNLFENHKKLINSGNFIGTSSVFSINENLLKTQKTLEYPEGKLVYNIWDNKNLFDCRFFTFTLNPSNITYDLAKIKIMIEYHNLFTREYQTFKNILDLSKENINPPELLNDFDSLYEIMIIYSFLDSIFDLINENTIIEFSNLITKSLNVNNKIFLSLKSLREKENIKSI